MTRSRSISRRRYLVASGAAGLAALAGCADAGPGDEDEADGEEPDDPEETDQEPPDEDEEPVEDVDHQDPEGEVAFVQPEDGDEVSSPVEIEAEVEEFDLEPAEEGTEDGTGHLHVIVDHGCVEPEYTIPQEDGYHHLSDGETSIELDLEPGEYDLCLQAGDGIHDAYDLTDEISIEVVEDGGDDTDGGNDTDENADDDGNGGGADENGTGENGDEDGDGENGTGN